MGEGQCARTRAPRACVMRGPCFTPRAHSSPHPPPPIQTGVQEDLGVSPFITVGAVAGEIARAGYKCYYASAWGLIPFPTAGTPEGDALEEGCTPTYYAKCSRASLYSRQFWSNILCARTPEDDAWVEWMEDALVSPLETRERLLKRG